MTLATDPSPCPTGPLTQEEDVKAIRVHQFGGPDVLQLDELPGPAHTPRQVVVRVLAAGVNPVDTYIRAGAYTRVPNLPYIPGSEGAGIVEAVGSEVEGVKPGNRVYILKMAGSALPGTYTEMTVCDPTELHPLADNLSFEQGAAVGIAYATAYRALLQRAHAMPGDTILVHGASGGVGTASLQIARSRGMRVIGTAGTERGLELVRKEGAHFAVSHSEPEYMENIVAFTGGRGVDVVLEMRADLNLSADLKILAPGGRVAVIGSRGSVEINPRDVMSRDAAIHGMILWSTGAGEMARIQAALAAGFESGTLRPVVGRTFPLAQAPLAHEAVMAPGAYGKVVLRTDR
jgi:NADPH2:quinone reductase